jgi:hypothetical protein
MSFIVVVYVTLTSRQGEPMSEITVLEATDDEKAIAMEMLLHRGDLGKVSREEHIPFNVMGLRDYVRSHPQVRMHYHSLLADELQEKGLHVAERILKMAELQEKAFGDEDLDIPPDPRMVIELSKEISRLIAEGKGGNMSGTKALVIANKKDAKEILQKFLEGN